MAAAAKTEKKGQFDEKLWSGMKWREIGPFRGGRGVAIEGVPGEPNTYYFGAVAGGVWKTTDGGANWKPMFDKQHSTSSIGALAVAPSDHNTIYAGAGESALRGNITYGDGVYKSVDGGRNWRNVGLKDTRHIGAIIVHPENPDIVFVAALAAQPQTRPPRYTPTDDDKRQVAGGHAVGQLAPAAPKPGRERTGRGGEERHEHGVSAQGPLALGRMPGERLEVVHLFGHRLHGLKTTLKAPSSFFWNVS